MHPSDPPRRRPARSYAWPALGLLLSLALADPAAAQWTNRYPQVGRGHHVYLEGWQLPVLTAGPMDAAVSPDGSAVVVASEGWLWVLDPETGVARQLTDGGALDSRPAWSPDGSRVVFVRDDGRDTRIVGKEIGSGEERVLVDTGAIDLDPVLTEDGTLWYASAREDRIEIWSMSPDGTHERRAGQGRVSRRPQPSPDGARLLYKQDSDRLALLDLRTGEEEVLFSGMQWVSQLDAALSPDGRRMAFVVPQGQGDGWELRVASLDRPGGTMLVAGGGDRLPLAPSWSPGGDWIWFSEAGRDEIVRLYRVPVVGGEVEEVRVRSWEASEPRGTLRLTTTLAGSPAPAATRVSIVDEEGHPIFPAGRQPRFDGQTGTVFFYSDGVVEVEAPAGPVTVRVARGLAAPVESRTISLQPGARADVEITLQPVWDARAAGWRSGDQHFHLNYGGPYRLDPEDAWESVAGEDLDVVTPLVGNLHERLGEQALFGWGPRGEAPIVRFGQEVRSHFLGHLGLIGTTELFWPWVWGPGYQVYGRDDRTNAEVTAHARAQGGLASYVHPSGADPFADPAAPGLPVELVADGVLGDVQAMEIACLWTDEVGTAEVWYHLLNLGHPVAATAGSDAMLNFYRTMAPGSTRAYVHTGAASDFDAFLEGLKAGRSFVTNGPLVEFTIEGAIPGEITPADGEAEWSLALHTAVGVETVDIIVNGEVVETRAVGEGAHHRFEGTVPIPGGGWVAVRILGPETLGWPAMDSYAFAHSSPVWIGGVGSVDDGAARRSAEVLLPALLGARASLERAYAGTDIPELRARFDEARVALEGWLGGGS